MSLVGTVKKNKNKNKKLEMQEMLLAATTVLKC